VNLIEKEVYPYHLIAMNLYCNFVLLSFQPVNAFGLLGGCLLSIGTIGLMAENAIRPRINGIFQQAF